VSPDPRWTAAELVDEASGRFAGRSDQRPRLADSEFSPRTLRFYRSAGLISPPLRGEKRKCLYDARHLRELVTVRRLKRMGWDLGRIRLALEVVRDRAEILDALAETGADTVPEDLLHELERLVSDRSSKSLRDGDRRERQAHRGEFRTSSAAAGPTVSSICLATGVYLVVDRAVSGSIEPEVANRVAERAAAWLTGESEESRRDDGERGGRA